MPIVQTCKYCTKTLDMTKDEITPTNRGVAKTEAEYIYAHVACFQEHMAQVRNARPNIAPSYARRSVSEF
jgi:hypothetical protein